jgi:hypothetical protein
MANAYQPSNGRHDLDPALLAEDDWDIDADTNLVKLLEENARLRALVVQLSDLVLKNVAEQK